MVYFRLCGDWMEGIGGKGEGKKEKRENAKGQRRDVRVF